MNIFITGLYGSLDKGLGKHLSELKWLDLCLELSPEFMKRKFQEQITLIKNILDRKEESMNIIAVSYGAYLLLQALIHKKTDAKILLFSPVLGITMTENIGRIPKGFKNFKRAISDKSMNIPSKCKIIVGSNDPCCTSNSLQFLIDKFPNIQVRLIQNIGHKLPHEVVLEELDSFK